MTFFISLSTILAFIAFTLVYAAFC
ncbi:hypothetical protein ACME9V_26345 [Klebsiella pneumoniae]